MPRYDVGRFRHFFIGTFISNLFLDLSFYVNDGRVVPTRETPPGLCRLLAGRSHLRYPALSSLPLAAQAIPSVAHRFMLTHAEQVSPSRPAPRHSSNVSIKSPLRKRRQSIIP